MRHAEFALGETFWCNGRAWRCTDIGTRIVAAIRLDRDDDTSWYNGPPYAVAETIFDEDDQEGCTSESSSATPDEIEPPQLAVVSIVPQARGNDSSAERARSLKPQAQEGGLRFDAYLPPSLAEWVLDHIASGAFDSPSEAVFVLLGEQQELEPHRDLRDEILRRSIQAAIDDHHPPIPAEDVMAERRIKSASPRPKPALWQKGNKQS